MKRHRGRELKAVAKSIARNTLGRLPPPASRLSGSLALHGGAPVRDVRLRPFAAALNGDLVAWLSSVGPAFRRIFLSGVEGLPQPLARDFERRWADYCGCRHALLLPHGTDALRIALAAAFDHDGLRLWRRGHRAEPVIYRQRNELSGPALRHSSGRCGPQYAASRSTACRGGNSSGSHRSDHACSSIRATRKHDGALGDRVAFRAKGYRGFCAGARRGMGIGMVGSLGDAGAFKLPVLQEFSLGRRRHAHDERRCSHRSRALNLQCWQSAGWWRTMGTSQSRLERASQ